MSTLAELIRLGKPPKGRLALSVALGSLTVLLGVGLMSLAGYVISRAAEHPPILELTVAMVAVRACGIGRPIARYFDRLESHDLAFRVLARVRGTFFRGLEPQVPARVEGYRRGDLLARMVDDVDAMQNLFLRGITPPLVAIVAGGISVVAAALFVPAAGAILAVGLVVGGIGVPALAAVAGGRAERGRAALRAELSAEIVDLLRGGPELVVLGADRAAIEAIRRLDAELARRAGRSAVVGGLVEGVGIVVAGLTVAAVLAVCVHATALGSLDRVFVASVALLAMAAFECVAPLPAAGAPTPRDLGVWPARPGDRRRGPRRARAGRAGGPLPRIRPWPSMRSGSRTRRGRPGRSATSICGSSPDVRSRSSAPPARGRAPSRL